jgi:hypothetical protein
MAKSPYTDSTPVPDPVSPEKKKPTAKVAPKPAPKPSKAVQYPDSTPVPDPVTYAKGGSIDGIAQRGKTRGRMC